jgi:beta-glucosidase
MVKQMVAAFFIGLCCVFANAAVTGRVLDGAGKPVYDAMVGYTNLANRLIYVYTNDKGEFSIPGPAEWKLTDLPMYKSWATTFTLPQQHRATLEGKMGSFDACSKGALVVFSVREGGKQVQGNLYDLSGHRIFTIFDRFFSAGTYAFDPFSKGNGCLADQLYIVSLTNGSKSVLFSMMKSGAGAYAGRLSKGEILDASSQKARAVLAVDNLRAGKTGYKPAIVSLDSYAQSVGDLTITAIDIEGMVDTLLKKMSVDEKIGQTAQAFNPTADFIKTNFLGSFLKGRVYNDSKSLQDAALSTRLKIPMTIGNDVLHGGNPIYFPHNIGLGACGDQLLVEIVYRATAINCLSAGNNVDFAPCIDIPRDDRHGRVYEGWSEVTDDTKIMARAAVRGLQGTDLSSETTVLSTAKHYAGAGGTQNGDVSGKTNTGSWSVLAKIHLPQFKAAVDAGVASVMTAYSSYLTSPTDTTQLWMTAHKVLITDTLKNAWKFDGFIITDWNQITTVGEAKGINAGQDVAMATGDAQQYINNMKTLVGNGTIPMSRLDDAVKRHLRAKFRKNLFEKPMPPSGLDAYNGSNENRLLARMLVRKSIVLLKNDNGVLPLKKTAKIHVVGAWADNVGYQCGGWSSTGGGDDWQGSGTPHGVPGATTLKEALTNAVNTAGGGRVTYNAAATGIPADADVIVVGVGETNYAEQQGTWADITLKADQQTLVSFCAASGKPVVVVIISGRPIPLGTVPTSSKAIVAAWLPGTEGTGIADVLFNDYNFEGKLKFSWPATLSQEPINTGSMGDRTGSGGAALYPYGHGLKY